MPNAMTAEAEHKQASTPDCVQKNNSILGGKKNKKDKTNGKTRKYTKKTAAGGGNRYAGRPT